MEATAGSREGSQAQENAILQEIGPKQVEETEISITDITLEQALQKLQELETVNMSLRDYMRENNSVMKKQFETLTVWKKRDTEKFEQTKALITALRAENEDLQVKVMVKNEKEAECNQRIQSLEEENAHLMRQKALSDQRAFNVCKQAEEQGLTGVISEGDDQVDLPDTVFVSSVEKEHIIADMEEKLSAKEEKLAQYRADLVKKDSEITKYRTSAKQCLADMESLQKLKESIAAENRDLNQQLLQAQQQLHEQMQREIASAKRVMQEDQEGQGLSRARALGHPLGSSGGDALNPPHNMDDLVERAQSFELKKQEGFEMQRLKNALEEEKGKIEELTQEVQSLSIKYKDALTERDEARQEVNTQADRLSREYETKLTQMAQQASRQNQSTQPNYSEDNNVLRSQVLTLIKEVDEGQNKLSAAMAAINQKDNRISELSHMIENLKSELNNHWQNSESMIKSLRSQIDIQQKAFQENSNIKQQHQALQVSFDKLVTDYKDLIETYEAYRKQMEKQPATPSYQAKEMMEELNRLSAQVFAADEAIAVRDYQILELRGQLKSSATTQEDIQAMRFQINVYENDFAAEREARTRLKGENEKLKEEIQTLQEQNRTLTEEMELHNNHQINEMQRRVGAVGVGVTQPQAWASVPVEEGPGRLRATPPLAQGYRAPGPDTHIPFQLQASEVASPQTHEADEEIHSLQQFHCPSCGAQFPDFDSVQLHVPECIDGDR